MFATTRCSANLTERQEQGKAIACVLQVVSDESEPFCYLPEAAVPKKSAGVVPNDFLNMEINALGVL